MYYNCIAINENVSIETKQYLFPMRILIPRAPVRPGQLGAGPGYRRLAAAWYFACNILEWGQPLCSTTSLHLCTFRWSIHGNLDVTFMLVFCRRSSTKLRQDYNMTLTKLRQDLVDENPRLSKIHGHQGVFC